MMREERIEKLERIRLMVLEFDELIANSTDASLEADGGIYKIWNELMLKYYPQKTGW